MKTKDLKIALEAERKLVFRLIDHPADFEKLPKKGLFLPKSEVIIPLSRTENIGSIRVLPEGFSLERLKKSAH